MSNEIKDAKSTLVDLIIQLLRQREMLLILAGLVIGFVIGILIISYAYFWLQKPSFLIDPVINHAVEATIAARPTLAPVPTHTVYPTFTPYPTYTLYPTFTPYPTLTANPPTVEATQPSRTCADYSIKITSPTNGATVSGQFQVSGSYTLKPPEGSLLLMVKSPDSTDYWPSSTPVKIDETLQRWSGEVYIFGNPPIKEEIIAAIVGKSGRALFEYYVKVGTKTNNWESINILTEDVIICDRITIEKK